MDSKEEDMIYGAMGIILFMVSVVGVAILIGVAVDLWRFFT